MTLTDEQRREVLEIAKEFPVPPTVVASVYVQLGHHGPNTRAWLSAGLPMPDYVRELLAVKDRRSLADKVHELTRTLTT